MKKYFVYIAFASAVFFASTFAFAQFHPGESLSAIDSEDTISLDLKGMDIVEVLKTLASKGKMNLVVGSNVRGRVTMFLKDVDVKEAFEIILLANNLASDKKGDIVYVMTERDYEALYGRKYADKKEAKIIQLKYAKPAEVNKALNQIKTKIGKVIVDEASNTIVIIDAPQAVLQAVELVKRIDKPTTTKIFELNYANTADIKDKIGENLTKGVGMVQIDERTNKIIITDLEERMDEIEEIISALDDKVQQVLIEAKILEINLSDEYKLGIDWEVVSNEFQKVLSKDIGIKSQFKLASAGGLVPGGEIMIGAFGEGDYAAMVQALKKVGDANILSSPRITVLNNEEAKILVGSSEPYATNTVTQGTSTTTVATELNFLDIGVKLYVTPTINRDGFVSMKIRPEVSSSTSSYTYGDPSTTVPIVDTTHAETSVMVKDGITIIIAGLIKDERKSTTNKVPFLGDIPLVGQIFSKTEDSVTKKELVIFLTPHIISGETDYLKTPPSYPDGKGKFTMQEKPTFDRRKPIEVSTGYLREDIPMKKAKKIKEAREKRAPEAEISSAAEYFYTIKNKIMDNIYVPKKDSHILRGDKVRIKFSLYSGGNLASKPRVKESTNFFFNDIAIAAVEKAAPFPVFPQAIREHKKDFSLYIIYEPDK
ncbi:MAG: TonB C-terminal domain-containing protein [Candidatus Omnitrophica bacterium]|nr:TonB C-terminal domain-containing protein [Candidatus Omnitrophota bacterium]